MSGWPRPIPGVQASVIGLALVITSACGVTGAPELTVGSKAFTEGVILGEVLAHLARDAGSETEHRRQLGGTQVVWGALTAGQIDAYVEYTGTLSEEVFGGRVPPEVPDLARAVGEAGVAMSAPLGFANTYALGMRRDQAEELGIEAISDLRDHPRLSFGFSTEFMDRTDGWPGLRNTYRLPQGDVVGLEHALAYRALAEGGIDVTDLYTTDPEIAYHDLVTLEDDTEHFPDYRAVILYRRDLRRTAPDVVAAFRRLEGRIDAAEMVRMNAAVQMDRRSESAVAGEFLQRELGVGVEATAAGFWGRFARRTLEHLTLVGVSLAAAILCAVPLGIYAARRPAVGAFILGGVGILQTIPSLALLVFMIPLLGIGGVPAMAALFLYSLLPIVRNTTTGLASIPTSTLESADALGLPGRSRLRLVELPIASATILAGVKTAAVINVGTATLGALIGAGGYGQPILTGIRLDDMSLILQGAVPAAALALLVQGGFALLERVIVPRGLRL